MDYHFVDWIPLHHQIRQRIETEIRSGHFAPGTRIPSEAELCRQFGVSRPTVRQALEALVRDGVLERKRGVGTFVTETRDKTKLTFVVPLWYVENATRALAALYMKRHPEIKINVIAEPFDVAINLLRRSKWSQQPGSVDIIMVSSTFMSQVANSGFIEPLEHYIQATGLELETDWLCTRSGQNAVDLMCAREVPDLGRRIFGLPYQNDVQVLFYRKDLLDVAGIEVPQTVHDYISAVKQVHQYCAGTNPRVHGTAISANPDTLCIIDAWLWILKALGGDLFGPDMTPLIDTEVGIESLALYKELFTLSPDVNSRSYSSFDVAVMMRKGQVAMAPNWHIFANLMDAEDSPVAGKIGYSLVPGGRSQLAGWELCLSSDSENKEVAFDFMRFLISPDLEVQETFQREGGDSYRHSSVTNQKFIARDPVYKVVLEAWKDGWTLGEWVEYERFALCLIRPLQSLLHEGTKPRHVAKEMARLLAFEVNLQQKRGCISRSIVSHVVTQ